MTYRKLAEKDLWKTYQCPRCKEFFTQQILERPQCPFCGTATKYCAKCNLPFQYDVYAPTDVCDACKGYC